MEIRGFQTCHLFGFSVLSVVSAYCSSVFNAFCLVVKMFNVLSPPAAFASQPPLWTYTEKVGLPSFFLRTSF